MQIFKRMTCGVKFSSSNHSCAWYDKRFAQNLIEFIFVLPILLFLTLVIFEVALFWQDVNSVYNLNAEINANIALLDYTELQSGVVCPAVDENKPNSAISILKNKDSMISLTNPTYTRTVEVVNKISQGVVNKISQGAEPFALYKIYSNNIVESKGKPQISLWVDCRNPFEDGVTTQIEFYHKTLIMKASIPRFDKGEPIEVIPEHVFITSPRLNTIRHY